MIEVIAHAVDIHIPKSIERHIEFKEIFNKFYKSLKEKKPDRIVIGGDVYDQFIDIEGEALVLLGSFLNNLSMISPVIIIKGNHDYRKRNINRIDTIRTAITMMENPKIIYYDKSGFYEDENVVWVIWDHIDKINPWGTYKIKKDKTKTYIDIFHDPVDGCKFFNDYVPKSGKMRKTAEFKGDISMFNDIHLRQSFCNGTKAFSGSLLQLNFGEHPYDHGYLLWDVKNRSFEEINIPNDYAFIEFEINPGQDYDNLELKSDYIVKHNKFRVEWTDYAANITNENETKIRKYLKDKYDAINVEVQQNRLYTDIRDGKMLSEVININDKKVQQNIIKEYLKENKFDNEFIEKIIEIDDIIDDRLQLSEAKNILWSIDKFWFSNFKSYGDNCEIEWDNVSGIIQIAGENQQGKTTILDAICFILYGTTLSTMKIEKNGNNRYINRYRKLDYCEGGCIIDVNGEKFVMQRRVEREMKKGVIKSCPMTLRYYNGVDINDDNEQTGENKVRTQKILDEVLGDFQDFIRMCLTNADNLNQLLSMDRSVFIDSIVRDAGYDVFEKKLDEFKEYKKENVNKISLNIVETENQIERMSKDLDEKQNNLLKINEDILSLDEEKRKKEELKYICVSKLHKINEDVLNININTLDREILESGDDKERIKLDILEIENDMVSLPKEFDDDKLDKLTEQYNKYISEKNKREIELVNLKNLFKKNEDKINNVDRDIQIEKNKHIDFLRNNIGLLRIKQKETLNEITNNYNIKKNKLDNQINRSKDEISILKQKGLDEKKNISNYNDMLNGENQICPTCNQIILNKDEKHINNLITESSNKIKSISDLGKQKMEALNEINSNIEELKNETDKMLSDKKDEFDNGVKSIQNKIDNFDLELIKDKIDEIKKCQEQASTENEYLKNKIEERKNYINKIEDGITKISLNISNLKIEKGLYDKYKNMNHNKDLLLSKIKDLQRIIEDNKRLLIEYDKNKSMIKENEENNKILISVDEQLVIINNKKSILLDDKLSNSNEITLLNKSISDLKDKLDRYIEQEKREEIYNVYLKLMHRTGLPTYLLAKNIDLLNKELSSFLVNTDFILFFDDDLNLKLSHKGKTGEINAIETSGMERTFSAIVLKMVLRIINFKSKPNFMFMDEVLNRLYGKSVYKFMELLETLRKKIDKIIVIEHNNEIQSDLIINVEKDKNGISSFEII